MYANKMYKFTKSKGCPLMSQCTLKDDTDIAIMTIMGRHGDVFNLTPCREVMVYFKSDLTDSVQRWLS